MRKLIACLFMALGTGAVSLAQDGFGPSAGDISISMQLGKAESFSNLKYYQSVIFNKSGTYNMSPPIATTVSANDNSLVNMIGVEAKFFVADQIAIRLSGMGIIDLTPSQDAVEGLTLPGYNSYGIADAVVPAYSSIESKNTHRFIVNFGGDYYFNVGARRVHPYVGVMATFNYGRGQYFEANQTSTTITDGTTVPVTELGSRFSETYGLGGSMVGGVDYYVADGMFIGLEVKTVSYLYSVNKMMPVAGVEAYDADNHNLGFLTNPMFKIGFTF